MLLIVGLAAIEGRAKAATIDVDQAVIVDADGQCSLIEAIVNANADSAVHADCAAGSGQDLIVLVPGFVYTANSAFTSGLALPAITSDVLVEGNNATIRRADAAPRFRLLEVAASGTLVLGDVTVTGGHTNGARGGGIQNLGNLNLHRVTLTGNRTGDGVNGTNDPTAPTSGSPSGAGGGLFSQGPALTLTDCVVSQNTTGNGGQGGSATSGPPGFEGADGGSAGSGGGIAVVPTAGAVVVITTSAITDNHTGTGGDGGGGAAGEGLSGSGGSGGGILVQGVTTITVDRSLIAGNTVGLGGTDPLGVPGEPGLGAGIAASAAPSTLVNTTIAGNGDVTNARGGIHAAGGTTAFQNSTITQNVGPGISSIGGGTMTLASTIVADNAGDSCVGIGAASDGGFNLDSGATCGFATANSSRPDTSPGFSGGLQDNGGGPTHTIALAADSPAVDAIPPGSNGCGTSIALDQRQIGRPQGGGCEIGAFELDVAEVDAGPDSADAGADGGGGAGRPDAGVDDGGNDGGCGCRAGGDASTSLGHLLLLVVTIVVGRRRSGRGCGHSPP